jgi:hypothetical protein
MAALKRKPHSPERTAKIRAWTIAFWQRIKADPEAYAAQRQKMHDGFIRRREKGRGFFHPKK